ncbi:MAG TPA: pyridoxal-dependent decarboxylase [Acidobacteriaceae bacterium]|jgi:glutamate/tyrosine decarboxylase-like PLP-dependent enzyme|nr:pyridoxal-dependent decarboxylase [Acidobacteriaceae bacterium]
MGFDFDRSQRKKLGYQLIDRINDYFSGLSTRPVQQPSALRSFVPIESDIPELGEDAAVVLDDLCNEMIRQGFHVPSANYFGLMNPTPTYMAVLAEALVAALNPQLATLARSQLASKIENETIGWIAQRVGWQNENFGGTFTSGGNEANFSALALALTHRFPEAADNGLIGLGVRPVVYASRESHHSLDKSLALLGLGRKALRRIAATPAAEIDLHALEEQIEADKAAGLLPLAVVGTAGTTSSGAMDPLIALAELCERHGLWFHVDAAFGGAAAFSDKHRSLVAGIERADSITIDPHKWLAMPFAAGVMLTRHPEHLETVFGIDTAYLPRTSEGPLPDNFRISAQWSRRMNSLKFWLTLRVHGRSAYEEMIDRQLGLAAYLEQQVLATGGFDLAVPRKLTILNLRTRLANELNLSEQETTRLHHQIVDEITENGEHWISTSRVNGKSVIRMMIISYLTEPQHVDALVAKLEAAARHAAEKMAAHSR